MKRIIALLSILFIIISSCIGQVNQKEKEPEIFYEPEIMPSFPDGDQEMMKFIRNNLKDPNPDTCIQGRVIVRFLVTESGVLDSIHVIRGVHPDFDREAIRVVKSMPKWNPGKQNGKNVPVYFTLPITLRPKGHVVYTVLDTMPEFPNGVDGMVKFINYEIMDRLPITGEHSATGRVVARFIVNKRGYIEDIKLRRTLSHTQDSIALDIIKAMPKWSPGIKDGEPVDCYYTIPIPFRHQ